MLERYFLRMETVDGIRASWIGPAIEQYVAWLHEHRYAARVVFSRVPTLMHFGTFAQQRGAKSWDDLPDHVDAIVEAGPSFIGKKRRTRAWERKLAGELRRPIDESAHLSVARTSLRAVYRSQYFSATVLPSMVAWPWSEGVPLMLPEIMISPT